eukprot:CAMPEP_0179241946 /NCGR_PEP_ID=MMETSP0797-20121207/16758_1 /TAXON_ID=47934 /ORGANISM="Dinophysis acuminata, Strain DAEP01" /LENGTH=188 /DNA_ID=CAMNT_0020949355 /DNA_START=52 /DNA_END=618 /DNA_ORIENTATION=+
MSLITTACRLRTGASRAATRMALGRPLALRGAATIPEGQGTATGPWMGGTWEENGYEVSPHNGAPKILSPWAKWFPYEPTPFSPKLGPYKVWCEKGVVYKVCACGESRTQPWCECDGAFNKERGFEPITYIPRHTGTKLLCGSKHQTNPIFNGTDWLVWTDVNLIPAVGIAFGASFVFGYITTAFFHP